MEARSLYLEVSGLNTKELFKLNARFSFQGCHQLVKKAVSALLYYYRYNIAVLHMHRLFKLLPDQPNAGIATLCLHNSPHKGCSASGVLDMPNGTHGSSASACLYTDHNPDAPLAGLPAQSVPKCCCFELSGSIH